jgi:hypothetical protein
MVRNADGTLTQSGPRGKQKENVTHGVPSGNLHAKIEHRRSFSIRLQLLNAKLGSVSLPRVLQRRAGDKVEVMEDGA